MRLLFATHNDHKVAEAREILSDTKIDLVSLRDLNIHDEIIEDGDTLEDNAWIKADFLYKKYKTNVVAEDTGLEVDALGHAPGVHSARYAGPDRSDQKNIDKLLDALIHSDDRSAQFRTALAVYIDDMPYQFEGIIRGHIATERSGTGGFGYDPIFIPEGYDDSFASLSRDIKNKISHRGRAFASLASWLMQNQKVDISD